MWGCTCWNQVSVTLSSVADALRSVRDGTLALGGSCVGVGDVVGVCVVTRAVRNGFPIPGGICAWVLEWLFGSAKSVVSAISAATAISPAMDAA